MKKYKFILFLVGILFLTSCGTDKKNEEISKNDQVEIVEEEQIEDDNVEEPDQNVFNLSDFTSVDLEGNPVDSSIFQGKYTLVNVWATFCRPCIVEMPDLQKIYENLGGDDFQVIGIISDTYVESNENMEDAKKIVEQTGVNYINVVPNDKIIEDVLKQIQFVPTSFIVDSEGNFLGEVVYGSKDYKFFESWINQIK